MSDEKLRANFNSRYLWRYVLIATVCLGWAGYCAFDLTMKYPKELEYAKVYYDELGGVQTEEDQTRWKEIVQQKNWPSKITREPPRKEKAVKNSINYNYMMGIGSLVFAIPAIFLWVTSRGTWIEETSSGLKTSWRQEVDYSKVDLIDKKKWEKKGIARVEYTEDGKKRFFIFDDFKYDRAILGKMLRRLEDTLSADQIVGGPSEAESQEQKSGSDEGPSNESSGQD